MWAKRTLDGCLGCGAERVHPRRPLRAACASTSNGRGTATGLGTTDTSEQVGKLASTGSVDEGPLRRTRQDVPQLLRFDSRPVRGTPRGMVWGFCPHSAGAAMVPRSQSISSPQRGSPRPSPPGPRKPRIRSLCLWVGCCGRSHPRDRGRVSFRTRLCPLSVTCPRLPEAVVHVAAPLLVRTGSGPLCGETRGLSPHLGYYEWCRREGSCPCLCVGVCSRLLGMD